VKTYEEMLSLHNVQIPPHLLDQVDVPVLTGLQRQGDIICRPIPGAGGVQMVPVAAGVQVIHGEATGNTHWLNGDAGVAWARVDRGQVIGIVSVPEGATAYLTHTEEHGCNGIGAGVYELRRKREMADEIRQVAD
jgi:hypothetical protein